MNCSFFQHFFVAILSSSLFWFGNCLSEGNLNHLKANEQEQDEFVETNVFMQNIGMNKEKINFSRLHQNAYYHLYGYNDTGEIIQLKDGSEWFVRDRHTKIVLDWAQKDVLFITPCLNFFSFYKYTIHNLTKNAVAEIDFKPPLSFYSASYQIVKIDHYYHLIYLNDNSIWQIDSQDSDFHQWQAGQRIVVGVNNGYRSGPLPHILINLDIDGRPFSQASFSGSVNY